jgi:hypothetical protein
MLSVVKGNDTGLKGFQTNKIEPKPVLRFHGFEGRHTVELAQPPEVHEEDLERGPDHQDQRGPAHLARVP